MSTPSISSTLHNGTFSASQMRKSKLACDLPWREKVREANNRTRYLFNGKELDTETNLYYYGARYYEPVTTLWYGVDPLAEKYPFNSSYVYCNGNPIRFNDPTGEGPEERIAAARNNLGATYKQELSTALRTEDTPDALEYMDCSEFVCRVMAADGLTDGVQHKSSGEIASFLEEGVAAGEFEKSTSNPVPGDIAVWEGHVGIVTEVNGEKIKLAHAAWTPKKTVENSSCINKEGYRVKGSFVGYFRPSTETINGGDFPEVTVEGTASYTLSNTIPILPVVSEQPTQITQP